MMSIVGIVGPLRAAIAFLTRIPVGSAKLTADDERWGPALFPLVGGLLGLVGGGLFVALSPLGGAAAAVASLAATIWITGAMHEDGLADTFDALGKGGSTSSRLDVMKDSRVGSFGAAALIVSIALRALLIERLGHAAVVLWPLAAAWARVGPVWQLVTLPYVTPSGRAKSASVMGARRTQAVVASLTACCFSGIAVVAFGVSPARGLAAMAVAIATTLATALQWRQLFGGITGDLLGATEQICETALLAVFAWSPQ